MKRGKTINRHLTSMLTTKLKKYFECINILNIFLLKIKFYIQFNLIILIQNFNLIKLRLFLYYKILKNK
jgi:hypothetical protein